MSDGLQGADDLMARFEALRTGKAGRQVLGRFGLLAVQRAKERVPRKTGNLDRTIRVSEVDETAQRVRVAAGGVRDVGYARHVEFGTRPHVILPRSKKALAWGGARRLSGSLRRGASATSFARRVNHPGTRARPYLVPGAQQALREVGLSDAVVSVWNEAA
jgi:hypothetical protein